MIFSTTIKYKNKFYCPNQFHVSVKKMIYVYIITINKIPITRNRPGKNWDLRILDPEEHFQKS
jgi:hypothetical protein